VHKKTGLGLVAILVVEIVVAPLQGCKPSGTGGAQSPRDLFIAAGAFEDEKKNRIYTIAFKPGVSAQTVRAHADGLQFMAGRETAAYFYSEDAVIPLHAVTFSSTIDLANAAIYETRGFSPWSYAFKRDPGGVARFVDCRQTPDDAMCRKH